MAELCTEAGFTRQTLHRHGMREGELRSDGKQLLQRKVRVLRIDREGLQSRVFIVEALRRQPLGSGALVAYGAAIHEVMTS